MINFEYKPPKITDAKEKTIKGKRIIWIEQEKKRQLIICDKNKDDFTNIQLLEDYFDSFEDWIKKIESSL